MKDSTMTATTATLTDFTALYDCYTQAASTSDPEERLRLLSTCTSDDVEIISPFPYQLRGRDQLAAKLGEVAAAMPDGALTIARTGELDTHHNVFRVHFENRATNGEVLSSGMHVVDVENGLIRRLVVFVPAELNGVTAG